MPLGFPNWCGLLDPGAETSDFLCQYPELGAEARDLLANLCQPVHEPGRGVRALRLRQGRRDLAELFLESRALVFQILRIPAGRCRV